MRDLSNKLGLSMVSVSVGMFQEGWGRSSSAWWRVCCEVLPLGCYLGGCAPRQDYADALQGKGNSHGGYQREGLGPGPEGDQGPELGQDCLGQEGEQGEEGGFCQGFYFR